MTDIATRTPQQMLVARVRSADVQEQIALALPPDVPLGRFTRGAVTALLQNPDLAEGVDPNSLLQGLLKCALDGLIPDGREAALVKRGGKISYNPMIGGFQKIAADHGWILRTAVVYENDEFDFTDEPPTIRHRSVRPGAERGNLAASYAVATHKDGRRLQAILHPEDVAKRRGKAQTQVVWNEWTAAMWAKSAGRALFKQLPLADRDRVERVLAADHSYDESVAALYGPRARQVPQDPPAVQGPAGVAAVDQVGEPSGGDGQQAGDARAEAEGPTSEPGPPSPASPAPDPGEGARRAIHEFGEALEELGGHEPQAAEDEYAERNAVAAGRVKVPASSDRMGGKTLDEINALGLEGVAFFEWSAEPDRAWHQPDASAVNRRFGQALHAYLAWHAPDLLGEGKEAA